MKPNPSPPEVSPSKCVGCGLCLQVCPSFVLDVTEGKCRVAQGEWCIECAHCGAICPVGAISHKGILPDSHPRPWAGPASSPETLELLFRERRSIRVYENEPIPDDILGRILDAGRFAPTGTNSQNVHYVVLRSPETIGHLRRLTIDFYAKIFTRLQGRLGTLLFRLFAGRRQVESLRHSLPKLEYAKKVMEQGKDCLFYHAPAVVVAHAESWDTCSHFNCSVALYQCSLLGHTLGVGSCFNGYLVSAVNHDRKIKRWLAIPPDHKCYAAMALGVQKLRYPRLVKREPAKVTWR
jgi:nitroreductase/NAD-dependent dihydropyrimidine dehydrogenase PreA subunit